MCRNVRTDKQSSTARSNESPTAAFAADSPVTIRVVRGHIGLNLFATDAQHQTLRTVDESIQHEVTMKDCAFSMLYTDDGPESEPAHPAQQGLSLGKINDQGDESNPVMAVAPQEHVQDAERWMESGHTLNQSAMDAIGLNTMLGSPTTQLDATDNTSVSHATVGASAETTAPAQRYQRSSQKVIDSSGRHSALPMDAQVAQLTALK